MKERSSPMQALRALACLWIFCYHCYLGNTVEWGVSVFFVMSGFLLTLSRFEKAETLSLSPLKSLGFAWGKIKKLYPLYIIALLPILALDMYNARLAGSPEAFAGILKRLAASIVLVQAWSPGYCMAFNGVAWYLSASVFLYFCFPYILRLIRSYRGKTAAFTVIVLLFALEAALSFLSPAIGRLFPSLVPTDADTSFEMWFTYIFPPFRLIDFALGCNLGYIFINRNKNEKPHVKYLADAAALILFAVSVTVYRITDTSPDSVHYKYSLLFAPAAMAAVYCFALGSGLIPRLFTNRFTLWLGDISGYFYLIHQDVIRALLMLSGYTAISFTMFRVIAVPTAFCITAACSVLYKRLSRKRKKPRT